MNIEWLGMSKSQLREKLLNEFEFPKSSVDDLVDEITDFAIPLRSDFKHFLETGEARSGVSVSGFDIARLMNDRRMTPVAAYSTLQWLLTEPEEATASLNRGYDTVIP